MRDLLRDEESHGDRFPDNRRSQQAQRESNGLIESNCKLRSQYRRMRTRKMLKSSNYWEPILLISIIHVVSISLASAGQLLAEQNRPQVRHNGPIDEPTTRTRTVNLDDNDKDQYVVHYQQSMKPKTTKQPSPKLETNQTSQVSGVRKQSDDDAHQERQAQLERILALAASIDASIVAADRQVRRAPTGQAGARTNNSTGKHQPGQANSKASTAAAGSDNSLANKNSRRPLVASINEAVKQPADISRAMSKTSVRTSKHTEYYPRHEPDQSGFDLVDQPHSTDLEASRYQHSFESEATRLLGQNGIDRDHPTGQAGEPTVIEVSELPSGPKSAHLQQYEGQTSTELADGQPLPVGPSNVGYGANQQHYQAAQPPPNVRVVVNNNQHYIIGSHTDRQHSFQRRARQPSSGLLPGDYNSDDYRPDESSPDETRVSSGRQQQQLDEDDNIHQRPCDKHQAKSKLDRAMPGNMEQIDLKEKTTPQQQQLDMLPQPQPPPARNIVQEMVPKRLVSGKVPQQQQQQPEEPTQQRPLSPPPPTKKQARPASKGPGDEQVDIPFEQLVKSGVRPPLRMVISMRNKQGEVMKVPVNLHGSISPKLDVGQEQMQVRFEGPEQQQSVDSRPDVQQLTSGVGGDENTPVGGDVFDPSIVKPFPKPPNRKPALIPTKTSLQQPINPQIPDEISPIVPPTKADEEPPVAGQRPTEDEKASPPSTGKKFSPNCQQQEGDKRTDSDKTAAPPPPPKQPVEQQQQQLEQGVILPMSVEPTGDGIVQMMLPKLTQFQNRTFADMFTQFQKALQHQMVSHMASQQKSDEEMKQDRTQQYQHEQQQQQHHHQQQQQQQQSETDHADEQEDLMVALMAANMSHPNEGRQVSMTVIKPPKGTTLQQALMVHASGKAGPVAPTVAILQSGRPRQTPTSEANGYEQGPTAQGEPQQQQPAATVSAIPVGVDITLRPAARPNPGAFLDNNNNDNNQNGPDSNGEVDPDGFSSSIIPRQASRSSLRSNQDSNNNGARFKRSTLDQSVLEPDDKLPKQTGGSLSTNAKTRKISSPEIAKSKLVTSTTSRAKPKSIQDLKKGWPKASNTNDDKSKKRKTQPEGRKQKDAIQVAASQQEEDISSDSSDRDDIDDDSDQDGDESSASDNNNHNHNDHNNNNGDSQDEEASASVPSSEQSSGGDDGDYGNDLSGDDFGDDSSSGFDSDDEPYNQAASSERISDRSSFEIPTIDINPDTLQQKGCRTVLREVQEIPMDGLGVVQANGSPGSGYGEQVAVGSGAVSQPVAGLRVKRQTGSSNDNLINSRKVTSIVMTKECHFPSDTQRSKESAKVPSTKVAVKSHNQVSPKPSWVLAPPDGRGQGRPAMQHVAPAYGGQAGASQLTRRLVLPATVPARTINQQQQTYLISSGPTGHIYTINNPSLPPVVAEINQSQLVPPQQQTVVRKIQSRSAGPTQGSAGAGPAANSSKAGAIQYNSDGQHVATSSIKRRSVADNPQVKTSSIQQPQIQKLGPPTTQIATPRGATSASNDNMGAASRRNEVVAQKLYKPPSADDPYHTLSYSSSRGADPDMEEDDDDSFVMGPDESSRSESRSESRRPTEGARPSSGDPGRRGARPRPTETLSRSELEALQDPDHDDTDPVVAGGASNVEQQQGSDPSMEQPDADETDGDLGDESRPRTQRQRPIPIQSQMPSSHRPRQHQLGPNLTGKQPRLGRQQPLQKRQQNHRPQQHGTRHQTRVLVEDDRRPGKVGDQNVGFGKSFKLEREITRPPINGGLSSQLRHLKGGQQGFVSVDGKQRPVAAAAIARQMAADSREDRDPPDERYEDGDDVDEDEDNDKPADKRQSSASAPAAAPTELDEDPDVDPEYNPRETHLPVHTKPKRVAKSFAYVHRDLPKKGDKNPDDFVVSYGRGNLQTEHEDYDSDRDGQQPTNVRQHRQRLQNGVGRNGEQQRPLPSIKHEQMIASGMPAAANVSHARPIESHYDQQLQHKQVVQDDSVRRKYMYPMSSRPILISHW